MATLTITYPDAQRARIVDALCGYHGYTGDDTALARGTFARQAVGQLIRDVVRAWESQEARRVAAATAEPDIT